MYEHRIFEIEQFREELSLVAPAGHEEIARRLRRSGDPQLREHSHFGRQTRKLRAYASETWRHRIGSWRFFEIDDQQRGVSMIAACHHGSAY